MLVSPPQLGAALLGACIACAPNHAAIAATTSDRVVRVVDGDTIVLSSLGKTRLIGMNTPETVAPAQRRGAPPDCYGPEASVMTKQLLPVGTAVNIELDQEPLDKFGRSLAYVYVAKDGSFVNGDLVRGGFARAKAYPPNVRYREKLSALEAEARAEGRGLWGGCADAQPAAVSKPATKQRLATPAAALDNPGDVKNCADFRSYAEANEWYTRYFPRFGDVARLDGNGDGIPCNGLYDKVK